MKVRSIIEECVENMGMLEVSPPVEYSIARGTINILEKGNGGAGPDNSEILPRDEEMEVDVSTLDRTIAEAANQEDGVITPGDSSKSAGDIFQVDGKEDGVIAPRSNEGVITSGRVQGEDVLALEIPDFRGTGDISQVDVMGDGVIAPIAKEGVIAPTAKEGVYCPNSQRRGYYLGQCKR